MALRVTGGVATGREGGRGGTPLVTRSVISAGEGHGCIGHDQEVFFNWPLFSLGGGGGGGLMWENLKPHHTPSSEHPSYAPVPHTELAVVSPPPSQVYSSNRGEREVKHINLNGQILWSRQKKKSTHVLNHLQLVCTFPGVGRKDGVKRSPRINEISRSLYLL